MLLWCKWFIAVILFVSNVLFASDKHYCWHLNQKAANKMRQNWFTFNFFWFIFIYFLSLKVDFAAAAGANEEWVSNTMSSWNVCAVKRSCLWTTRVTCLRRDKGSKETKDTILSVPQNSPGYPASQLGGRGRGLHAVSGIIHFALIFHDFFLLFSWTFKGPCLHPRPTNDLGLDCGLEFEILSRSVSVVGIDQVEEKKKRHTVTTAAKYL